jgi:glycolate oxidase FAD binding subunit
VAKRWIVKPPGRHRRSYEPSELVVTVRAGTPLAEWKPRSAQQGQCLAFEPPRFAARAGTVGGMVAAGLAGPGARQRRRVRDYVLGATLLNGRGELLTFGGQVMKNVAGLRRVAPDGRVDGHAGC